MQVRRINWIDPGFQMLVFPDTEFHGSPPPDLLAAISAADIFFPVEVTSPPGIARVGPLMDQSKTSISFGPSQDLLTRSRLGGVAVGHLSTMEKAAADLGLWKQGADGRKVSCLEHEERSRDRTIERSRDREMIPSR